jgi:hypothetical protein
MVRSSLDPSLRCIVQSLFVPLCAPMRLLIIIKYLPALGTVILPASSVKVMPLAILLALEKAGPSPSVSRGLNSEVVLFDPAVETVELAYTLLVTLLHQQHP